MSSKEIVKIAIVKEVLNNLESLAAHRKISMDEQFEQTFTLFLGFYMLPKKERVEIMLSIAKTCLGRARARG